MSRFELDYCNALFISHFSHVGFVCLDILLSVFFIINLCLTCLIAERGEMWVDEWSACCLLISVDIVMVLVCVRAVDRYTAVREEHR